MEWDRINVIVRQLKSSARIDDKITFNAWMTGEITIDECISQFRRHNGISDRLPILKDEFVEWLWSLGYRRYYGKKK